MLTKKERIIQEHLKTPEGRQVLIQMLLKNPEAGLAAILESIHCLTKPLEKTEGK